MPQLPSETGTTHLGLPGRNWTLVLRRSYTDAYELICCDCGDDPDLDYRDLSPELRRIRGPYRMAAGVAAYRRHVCLPASERVRGVPARLRRPSEDQGLGQPAEEVHEPRP